MTVGKWYYILRVYMDAGPDGFRIRSFEETELPNVPYKVTNNIFPGSVVTVMPKHEGSQSVFPVQDHPTVFSNVALAIVNPDRWYPTQSTTTATQRQLKRGAVILYEKDNFFEHLDAPGLAINYPNYTLTVITLYKYDGSENPTLSYRFNKKSNI